MRNTTAIRSGPAQNGQLPLIRANRAFVGDWVHIFGGGTVFNLRGSYTYFLEWSQSDDAFGFDATRVRLALEPRLAVARRARSAACSRVINLDDFVSLSRGSGRTRNRNYTVQPNISLTRGKHNIRSGLDMRWTNVFNENYGNAGGQIDFTRAFTRSTLNSTSVLEGNAFASFLLGAPCERQRAESTPFPHYHWFFVAPWIQDDWRVNNKLTLNLGFRWDFNGSGHRKQKPAELRVRSDASSIRFGARRSAGVRRHPVRSASTARRTTPWKFDKNNCQLARRHGLLRSTTRRCCAAATASTS